MAGSPHVDDVLRLGVMTEPSERPERVSAHRPHLDAELEGALLRELMRTWHELNRAHFKGGMRAPVLRLSAGGDGDAGQTLGRWRLEHRTIELSRGLVLEQPWGATVEVLKHEMAHQYVHEVLRATDETAHGPAFQQVCVRLGIDAAASGMPEVDDPRRARLRQRVEGLLALANSPNRHEAENAAALAQRLILKHNIALSELPERRRYGYRHLGQPKGRHAEAEHILAAILAEHFFVEAIWVPAYRPREGKRGNVLEISGTPENLEMAAYVYDFLLQTGERLWRRHKREHDIQRNRDRRRFVAGVMEGFLDRLATEKRKNTEKGLVWVGDADLHRYYRRRHPHVRSVRLRGHGLDPTRARGRQAGRNIVLRRGVGEGEAQNRGRALPAGRRGKG